MLENLSETEVLRFQIQVPRADYRALVARLRGESTKLAPASADQSPVTALIDLLPNTSTFSVTRLGHHRLPREVSIRLGSPTHNLLTRSIFQELEKIDDPSISSRLQSIVDACPASIPAPLKIHPDDFIMREPLVTTSRVRVLAHLAPTILLDLDDTPTLVIAENPVHSDPKSTEAILAKLRRTLKSEALVSENTVTLTGTAILPNLPELSSLEIWAHWGGYDELAKPWQDELLIHNAATQSTPLGKSRKVSFTTTLHAPIHGSYGVAFYARTTTSNERFWIGRQWIDDRKFSITHDDPNTISIHYAARQKLLHEATLSARSLLTHPLSAQGVASWFKDNAPHISLGAMLASETAHSLTACDILTTTLSTLHQSGAHDIAQKITTSYGIGEIAFITPEGPHAAAGGLAHVISGLPRELANLGVPVTIIAPLYRYTNGNKHRSAQEVLTSGITLGTQRAIPQYITSISTPLGPTYYSGTGFHKRPPTSVTCKVYVAEFGSVRLVLLANSSTFDRIYQPVYADEQLRRAIVFSRSALETIATEALDIRPSVIISNDWMTACVPSFLTLDQRYRNIPWLRNSKTIHMIHNGGADYHGRLPIQFGNEDLWPLFGLAPEHYFGFRDPHRSDLINLTMGAAHHTTGGIITVSQPYAQELVSPMGGDGLEYVLQHRRDAVFGISNGINRQDIDTYLTTRTGLTIHDLRDAEKLTSAKAALRIEVQRSLGLTPQANATVISFVGRLAEQKGLDLLSGIVNHTAHSTLEDILSRHPSTQIIIAGPITSGDRSAHSLREAALYLQYRYPGRVATQFDYISHSTALEIMTASTLFLMPSRFEPGGITQLEALAVGTPVVGRSVGGIKATIENYDPVTCAGTGFLCHDYTPTAFANTIHWALSTCSDPVKYLSLVKQTISAHHSWADRAPTFLAVLQQTILGKSLIEQLEFLDPNSELVAKARV